MFLMSIIRQKWVLPITPCKLPVCSKTRPLIYTFRQIYSISNNLVSANTVIRKEGGISCLCYEVLKHRHGQLLWYSSVLQTPSQFCLVLGNLCPHFLGNYQEPCFLLLLMVHLLSMSYVHVSVFVRSFLLHFMSNHSI